MASIKQITIVVAVSAALIALIGMWTHYANPAPELLLETTEELPVPLSPNEIETMNPEITNTENRVAVLTTNKGIVRIELFEDTMPITTKNFITLAEDGFYNSTKFHRVIQNFMIQGGDPNSKGDDKRTYGTGGPGYTIQDEFVTGELLTNVRGTISMANTGQPNSGGSQFFINTKNNSILDFDKEPLSSRHPVFGRVIDGMDIVDLISNVPVGQNDVPVDPVIIESIEIQAGSAV